MKLKKRATFFIGMGLVGLSAVSVGASRTGFSVPDPPYPISVGYCIVSDEGFAPIVGWPWEENLITGTDPRVQIEALNFRECSEITLRTVNTLQYSPFTRIESEPVTMSRECLGFIDIGGGTSGWTACIEAKSVNQEDNQMKQEEVQMTFLPSATEIK